MPKETRDIASPGVALAGGCEPLDVGAGNPARSSGRTGHALQHHAFPPVQRTTIKKKKLLDWPFSDFQTNYKLIDTFLPSVTLTPPKRKENRFPQEQRGQRVPQVA